MINQHREEQESRVVDQFEATDLGAPFKVILKGCVKVVSNVQTGEMLSYTIPDPDGLLRTVVLARILHPRKLFAADIKFLRKAVGVMQKDLARSLGLSAEHLCKCESGALPLSVGSEKLLRLFLFKTVIKHHKIKDSEAKQQIEEALDKLFDLLTPVSVFDVEDEIVFTFYRTERKPCAANDGEDEGYKLEDAA